MVCGITSTPHGVEDDSTFGSLSTVPMVLSGREDDFLSDPLDVHMELAYDRPYGEDAPAGPAAAAAFATTRPPPSVAPVRSMLSPLSPTMSSGDGDGRVLGVAIAHQYQRFRLSAGAADLMEPVDNPNLSLHSPEHPARQPAPLPRRDGDEGAHARAGGPAPMASTDMSIS